MKKNHWKQSDRKTTEEDYQTEMQDAQLQVRTVLLKIEVDNAAVLEKSSEILDDKQKTTRDEFHPIESDREDSIEWDSPTKFSKKFET